MNNLHADVNGHEAIVHVEDVDRAVRRSVNVTDADLVAISEYLLDNALELLGSEPDIHNLVDSRLKHQALGTYLTQKVQGRIAKLEAANNLNEIRIRHERQIGFEIQAMQERGELLAKNTGYKRQVSHSMVDTLDTILSLADLSISHNQSSRWQQLTLVPDADFDNHIAKAKENGWELTTAGIAKYARSVERRERREAMAQQVRDIPLNERWHIEVGDMNNYQTEQRFNFIITDPPYLREYIDLYEVLAARANDWLLPGGLLIAMAGQSYLDEIIARMSRHLTYYWTCAYLTPGHPTPLRQRQVNTSWKPLLVFGSTEYKGKIFSDVFTSDGNDKSLHKWGQSESGMLSIISQICLPGESIFDPFTGAGTTGIAALKHGCLFTGIDIDPQSVEIAKARLHDHAQE